MELWKWSKYSSYEANHTPNKRQQQQQIKNKKQEAKCKTKPGKQWINSDLDPYLYRPKRAVYIRIQLNKCSNKSVLDAILLQRILVLEHFVSAFKPVPKLLSADKVNS